MKRFMDIFVSFFLLLLLSPVLILIYLLIVLTMGRPVFFIQSRPGLDGAPFRLIKFRTMRAQSVHHMLPDSDRITLIGFFLRTTSLDELPELLNVIKGEMSLVGPRPLLIEYLPLYNPIEFRRHEVRPGITGWAQINGRNALSWEEKFELDVWYVDNQSLWLDIKILFKTVLQVLRRDGVSHGEDATMPRFKGSNRDD
ncbi:MAG: sugar transferase [Alcanivorax sp.]|nr:sugar transferase [Alcanivorax sp.]